MQKLIELLTKELSTTEEDKESLYSLLQKEYLRRQDRKGSKEDQYHRDAKLKLFLKDLGFSGIKVFSPVNQLHYNPHRWGWLWYQGTFKVASHQGTFELKIRVTLSHEAQGMPLSQEFSILYSESSFDTKWTASDGVDFDFDVRKEVIIGYMAKEYCYFYGCEVEGLGLYPKWCDDLRQTVGDLMFSHFYPNSPGDPLYHTVSDMEDRIFSNTIYDDEDFISVNRKTDFSEDDCFPRMVTEQVIAKLEQDK